MCGDCEAALTFRLCHRTLLGRGGGGGWARGETKEWQGRDHSGRRGFPPLGVWFACLLLTRVESLLAFSPSKQNAPWNGPSLLLFDGGNDSVRRPTQLVLPAPGSQPLWHVAGGRRDEPACASWRDAPVCWGRAGFEPLRLRKRRCLSSLLSVQTQLAT